LAPRKKEKPMAVDMLIKIGDVTGESAIDGKKGWIDVLSWSFGASQAGSSAGGSGSGSGKVQVQDLTFTKYTDKATPTLLGMVCDGTHTDKVQLVIRKAGGKAPVEYLKVELGQVLVSSLTTGGSGGQDRLTETITLNFAKVKMEYTPQTDKGAADASVVAGWDLSIGKPWGK
jgi:type VI secretion system secreted protein Hcp